MALGDGRVRHKHGSGPRPALEKRHIVMFSRRLTPPSSSPSDDATAETASTLSSSSQIKPGCVRRLPRGEASSTRRSLSAREWASRFAVTVEPLANDTHNLIVPSALLFRTIRWPQWVHGFFARAAHMMSAHCGGRTDRRIAGDDRRGDFPRDSCRLDDGCETAHQWCDPIGESCADRGAIGTTSGADEERDNCDTARGTTTAASGSARLAWWGTTRPRSHVE